MYDPKKQSASFKKWYSKRIKDPKFVAAHAEKNRKWAQNNRERVSAISRKSHLKLLYGITEEQWKMMLETQGNCCACCRNKSTTWHTDHDHTTGVVRGILCPSCNKLLGLCGDSLEGVRAKLRSFENYLKGTLNAKTPSTYAEACRL